MEFPLNNVTQMHMQNTNRSNSYDQGSDMCSPTMAPSGSSPVYGPSVSTAHEQFIDVGSVDRVNQASGKKKGPAKGSAKSPQQQQQPQGGFSPKQQQGEQRRGVSPTNTQPYSPNIPNPRSRQPVGGKNSSPRGFQQSPTQSAQLASYQQQQMMLAMLGGAMAPSGGEMNPYAMGGMGGDGLTPEEVQHQNLEHFAALQASMQMMSYNNDVMMNYFSQIQQQQQHQQQASGSSPLASTEEASAAEAGSLPGGFTEYPRRGGSPTHPSAPHHQQQQMRWAEDAQMSQSPHHHHQSPYQGAYAQQQQYQPTQEEMMMMEQEYYAQQQQYQQQGTVAPTEETQQYPEQENTSSVEQPAVEAPAPVSQTPDKKPLQEQPQQSASGKKRLPSEKRPTTHDAEATEADDKAKKLEKESPAPAQKEEKTPSTRPSGRRDDRSDRRSTNPRDAAGRPERRARANEFVPRELFTPNDQHVEPVCIATVNGHFNYKFNGIRCPFDVRINDFIIFDGDRGVELGEVVAVYEVSDKDRAPVRKGMRHGAIARRHANEAEVYNWKTTQVHEAEFATEQAKALAQSLGLEMKVHCTAFQFDCKKLTVFYEAKERVDFRKFLAEMYAKVHCRIWMEDACELGYLPVAKKQE